MWKGNLLVPPYHLAAMSNASPTACRYYYRVGDGVTFSAIFNFTAVNPKGAHACICQLPCFALLSGALSLRMCKAMVSHSVRNYVSEQAPTTLKGSCSWVIGACH